jgi:hypothetical protein
MFRLLISRATGIYLTFLFWMLSINKNRSPEPEPESTIVFVANKVNVIFRMCSFQLIGAKQQQFKAYFWIIPTFFNFRAKITLK